jgi:hypothetical protein
MILRAQGEENFVLISRLMKKVSSERER